MKLVTTGSTSSPDGLIDLTLSGDRDVQKPLAHAAKSLQNLIDAANAPIEMQYDGKGTMSLRLPIFHPANHRFRQDENEANYSKLLKFEHLENDIVQNEFEDPGDRMTLYNKGQISCSIVPIWQPGGKTHLWMSHDWEDGTRCFGLNLTNPWTGFLFAAKGDDLFMTMRDCWLAFMKLPCDCNFQIPVRVKGLTPNQTSGLAFELQLVCFDSEKPGQTLNFIANESISTAANPPGMPPINLAEPDTRLKLITTARWPTP